MRLSPFAFPLALASALALAPAAHAEDEKKDDKAAATGDKADAKAKAKDDDEPEEVKKAEVAPEGKPKEETSPHDPYEEQGKTYYFIGARYRQNYLPKFMLNLFVAGGPTNVWIPSFGLEGTMRKDNFDTTLFLTYADWGMEPFPFKGKDEAVTAWEVVESRLKLINVGVDLLWSTDFTKAVGFQYGITAGIAAVLGDLKRVQGQPKAGTNDPENPDNIERCPGNGPTPGSRFCTDDNDHYGDYTEPSWFNGGKKPNIYASFGPQVGFRFKPVKEFMARVNIGWDLFAGPFFGINGSYGL